MIVGKRNTYRFDDTPSMKKQLDTGTKELAEAIGEDEILEHLNSVEEAETIESLEEAIENHLADVDEVVTGHYTMDELIEFLLETRDGKYVWKTPMELGEIHEVILLDGGDL